MTRRLYYQDATLRAFTASVFGRGQAEDETGVLRPTVRLDQTAFYPTSGGQPYDTGTLSGIRVVGVEADEAGEIWHFLELPLPSDVVRVAGEIDWSRRFDHMQQHSGQHLLSAVFEDLLGGHTIGFHLGKEDSTIDLDLPDLTWDAIYNVEREVNSLIWKDLPVTVSIEKPEDVVNISLRKPPTVAGDVRVIWVQDTDASACGGTHVRAIGEIGILKVTGVAHNKGGTRVHFLCGGRALADYQRTLKTLQDSGLLLTVSPDEVPDAISRMQGEAKTHHRELRRVRSELLNYEADRLWRGAPLVKGKRAVCSHWVGRDFAEARALATQLREREATVVLFAVTETAAGKDGGLRLVCARSDDLSDVDANAILRMALAELGGRGGGRPVFAQGGAPSSSPEAVEVALKKAFSQHL